MTNGLATLVKETEKAVTPAKDAEAPYGRCDFCCTSLKREHKVSPYKGHYCDDKCYTLFTED